MRVTITKAQIKKKKKNEAIVVRYAKTVGRVPRSPAPGSLRARSQIPVLGLTERAQAGVVLALKLPGAAV